MKTSIIFKLKIIVGLLFLVSGVKCNSQMEGSKQKHPKALFEGRQLYITISPDASYRYDTDDGIDVVLLDRMLVMHWIDFDYQPGDKIGLYSQNPIGMIASSTESYLLELHAVSGSSGKIKTSVRYERRPLDTKMNRCLGFWVAYLRNVGGNAYTAIKSNCLRIYPTWMNDIKEKIKDTPLTSLMIPGTHDAGSWIYYEGPESEGPYIAYTYCQEDSIYDQLVNGIRSLDIRVGYYGASLTDKFYVNHDIARIRPLRTLLEDVSRFYRETREIILLDFHDFPAGFDDQEIHDELVQYIQEYLGSWIAPRSLGLSVTPQKLWELKRSIIVFYLDAPTVAKYDFLWTGVNQVWAGYTTDLSYLESYLGAALTTVGCSGTAWSAQAELTETVGEGITNPRVGTRGLANISNDAVSEWFQRESWYSRSMIVNLDYYRSTNLIETAIEVNRNQANIC